jgi:hypothetical protein
MGNSTWRVILLRPDEQRLLFRAVTAALLLAFSLAAIAATWDVARTHVASRRRPKLITPGRI